MAVELPGGRTLAGVLRVALRGGDPVRLVRATGGVPLARTAPDYFSHVNVVVLGTPLKTPRVAGSVPPKAGGPAYLLATRDFMLYVGTVTASDIGGP